MNLLELLYQTQDTYTSGEQLSQQLNITRAAVWKQIKKLQANGVVIESSQSLGYKLISTQHYIEPNLITQGLDNLHLEVFDTIKSTNDYAKTITQKPALIIAKEQTAGKGRRGKSYYSPKIHGTYFSYIPNKNYQMNELSLITIRAALALNIAIKKTFGIDTEIKWLNDIYLQDHKLAGILVEGSIELQTLEYEQIIIGIGLNLNHAPIPKDIEDIYTSLNLDFYDLNSFFKEFIHQFESLDETDLISLYKSHSMIFGRTVIHSEDNKEYTAIDIDANGALILKSKEGELHTLSHGEVSLKIK